MEWGTVSAASIIGMAFSLVISIGFPIALLIIVYRKTHAKIASCFIGVGAFVVFALVLEKILHAIVLLVAGTALQNNIFLYGLYGGLAAALFEETGRFIAMKFFMKNSLDKGNALMYGVGHGGAESILIVGFVYVNNIINTIIINTGRAQMIFSQLDSAIQGTTYQQLQDFHSVIRESAYQQLQPLWQSPPYHFYMAGVERISAVILQICLSVLAYKCVKTGKLKYIAGALALHFIVDFVTVVTAGLGMPMWAVEIEVIVLVVIIARGVVRIYRKDEVDGEMEMLK